MRLPGLTTWVAHGKLNPRCPRDARALRNIGPNGDMECGDACSLNHICDQSHGLMTYRSASRQQDKVYVVSGKLVYNWRNCLRKQSSRIRNESHEPVVARRHPPETSGGYKFPQTVERKDHVYVVERISRVVVGMGDRKFSRADVAQNGSAGPVALVPIDVERFLAFQMDSRG